MRPKELLELLSVTIKIKSPVLIKGAPGIGKSDIVAEAADTAGANVVLMHPVVSDPTDFKGLPAIIAGTKGKDGPTAEFLPFGDLAKLINAKVPTVAFLDDLGQAPAVVQAAAMQLILARQVNGHKISDDVTFVAATNRKEDRAGVTGILEPVKSRFHTIVELQPNLDDWCNWAIEAKVDPAMIAFCRFRPKFFNPEDNKPTADIVNRPSPRTITNCARLYAAGLRGLEALAGAVGQGFATEFLGFVRLYKDLPSLDAILLSPMTAPLPKDPGSMYAVAVGLATKVTADNAGRAIKYFNRLQKEFAVLGIRDAMRACPQAANNSDFVEWAAANQDVLVG